ncbi:HpcH/HpaI aldolase family protein [Nocardia sp. NPDC004260]
MTFQPRSGSIGTLVGIDSPVLTEMISALGFDFLMLDLEHGTIADDSLACHVMASAVPVLARIGESCEVAVKRAADAGVAAVIAPRIRSVRSAAELVAWAKYPPIGARSVGLSRNTMLGYRLAEALADHHTPRILAQIEDVDGVANVEEICRVAGIDGVFIGPFDLSASLGCAGDLEQPSFKSAVEKITTAAHAAGLTCGVFCPTIESCSTFAALGVDYLVYRSDSLLLVDGARAALEKLRPVDRL